MALVLDHGKLKPPDILARLTVANVEGTLVVLAFCYLFKSS